MAKFLLRSAHLEIIDPEDPSTPGFLSIHLPPIWKLNEKTADYLARIELPYFVPNYHYAEFYIRDRKIAHANINQNAGSLQYTPYIELVRTQMDYDLYKRISTPSDGFQDIIAEVQLKTGDFLSLLTAVVPEFPNFEVAVHAPWTPYVFRCKSDFEGNLNLRVDHEHQGYRAIFTRHEIYVETTLPITQKFPEFAGRQVYVWDETNNTILQGAYIDKNGSVVGGILSLPDTSGTPSPASKQYRYIRSSGSGNSSGSSYVDWVEIQVFNKGGLNVAQDRPVLLLTGSSATGFNPRAATDGYIDLTNESHRFSADISAGPATIEIDLGQLYELSSIKHFGFWADNRYYFDLKYEGSEDGINWTTFYDSNLDGNYSETEQGLSIAI